MTLVRNPLPSSSLFAEAIDIPVWLERDRSTPYHDRIRRDREIARQVDAAEDVLRVRAWWQSVRDTDEPSVGDSWERRGRSIGLALLALGVVLGIGTSAAVFHYDGTHPVNVLLVLGLLVVAQLLFSALTTLLLFRPFQGLRIMGAASIIAGLFRRGEELGDAPDLFGWQSARHGPVSRFAKWQLLYWYQGAAVAFNVAALAMAFALVTFTDLAFGWSTTLNVGADQIRSLVESASVPWAGLVPDAVPNAALIERSQFFRLEGSPAPGAPEALTGWWPFLIAAVVVYGTTPRLVLLVVAKVRLVAATKALLLEDPRVTALLDRMSAPVLALNATEAEPGQSAEENAEVARPSGLSGAVHAVVWAGALQGSDVADAARARLDVAVADTHDAGGTRTLDQDRTTISTMAAEAPLSVVFFARAWEPPVLELLDFLTALRIRLGAQVSIVVVPVADESGRVHEVQARTWRRAIARLGDPHAYVEVGS